MESHYTAGMKQSGRNFTILILEEKLRALNTLVLCEKDPNKQTAYKNELAIVAAEINSTRRLQADQASALRATA